MSDAVPMLHDYLESSAHRLRDKVALACGDRSATYGELDALANAFAHALQRRGVQRGDRVVIFADNSVECVVAFWGTLKANAVASVVNPLTKAGKLAYLLNDCRATALVSDAHLGGVFIDAAARSPHLRAVFVSGRLPQDGLVGLAGGVAWDAALSAERASAPPVRRCLDVDLAAIVYTSGSTGEPKGVMLTHRNMLAAAASVSSYLGMRETDVVLAALPLAFDYGLYQVIMSFRVGARVVLERSFAYPAALLNVVVKHRVTGFPGVPTMFAVLSDMNGLDGYDFSAVRYVTSTAAALGGRQIERLRALFPGAQIFSMYGLTECKRCSYLPPQDLLRKPGSVGIAIPNTELWLVDERGDRVPPGQTGQLVIRGATVMRGYWEKPEATARKLRPGPLPGELVLYTGDYCRQDEEGYLYFVGRMDDMIKSRGEKVAPKEVESVITDIAGVKYAAVIGVPDDLLGEAVKAFVVLEAGARLGGRDIQRECQKRLENFMVPKVVEIVADLPTTATGKVTKAGLS